MATYEQLVESLGSANACALCRDGFVNGQLPVPLACQHVFCSVCVDVLYTSGMSEASLQCTVCRISTSLPLTTVDALYHPTYEQAPPIPASRAIRCSAHPYLQCLAMCADCSMGLCAICIWCHDRGHAIEDMRQNANALAVRMTAPEAVRLQEWEAFYKDLITLTENAEKSAEVLIEKTAEEAHKAIDEWKDNLKMAVTTIKQEIFDHNKQRVENAQRDHEEALSRMNVSLHGKAGAKLTKRNDALPAPPPINGPVFALNVGTILDDIQKDHGSRLTFQPAVYGGPKRRTVNGDGGLNNAERPEEEDDDVVFLRDSIVWPPKEWSTHNQGVGEVFKIECGAKDIKPHQEKPNQGDLRKILQCRPKKRDQPYKGFGSPTKRVAAFHQGRLQATILPDGRQNRTAVHPAPSKRQFLEPAGFTQADWNEDFIQAVHNYQGGANQLIAETKDAILLTNLNDNAYELIPKSEQSERKYYLVSLLNRLRSVLGVGSYGKQLAVCSQNLRKALSVCA